MAPVAKPMPVTPAEFRPVAAPTVHEHFACNDTKNGRFTGRFEAIEFHGADGETLASMTGRKRSVQFAVQSGCVYVSGKRYKITGYHRWCGTWCWDAVTMSETAARSLFRKLKFAGWYVDEWSHEGPLADLIPPAPSEGSDR